jgi:hypothetical protein
MIHSGSSGLRVSTVSAPFQFTKAASSGSALSSLPLDPEEALRKAFAKITSVDLSEAYAEFDAFKDSWQSCYPGLSTYNLANPVFTRKGDLLFELQPASEAPAASTT